MTATRTKRKKAPTLDRDHAIHLLTEMIRIRRLEEACAEQYSATKIRGFLHLYIGQEAVATGVMQALEADDAVLSTYREHGHALVRGLSMDSIMAEMFGKVDGCSRGRGGSMHLFDAGKRFYGGNAIVGGGLPLAVGLALADLMKDRNRVTACFFGDGAAAEGEFQETLNLACLWQAPVLFLCENNHYAMGTALAKSHAQTDLASKARAHGIPAEQVDGMDVVAVEAAARKAVEAIRRGAGPQFLEFLTYRFRAHSMYDAELYRSKEEVREWMKRDPIETFARRLREEGLIDDETLAGIEAAAAEEVAASIAFAEASPWEPVEDLERFVHSERSAP
jgi:pyruvate dehydrogenase E1 component alpha subunit